METIYDRKLDEEILSRMEEIENTPSGTEVSEAQINEVTKLLEKSIKLKELSMNKECQMRRIDNEYEAKLIEVQCNSDNKIADRKHDTKIAVITGLVSVGGAALVTMIEKSDIIGSTVKEWWKKVQNIHKR